MKKSILLLLVCGICSIVKAQDVLVKEISQVSGFLSIDQMVSTYNNDIAYEQGVSAAALFNQAFYVGGYTSVLLTGRGDNYYEENAFGVDFRNSGLWIGYILNSDNLVHFDFNTKIGVGALKSNMDVELPFSDFEPISYSYKNVFVIQPNAGVEVNIAKAIKVNAHVGYRYVSGISDADIQKDVLNGLTGQVGLLFGWFGQGYTKRKLNPDAEMRSL